MKIDDLWRLKPSTELEHEYRSVTTRSRSTQNVFRKGVYPSSMSSQSHRSLSDRKFFGSKMETSTPTSTSDAATTKKSTTKTRTAFPIIPAPKFTESSPKKSLESPASSMTPSLDIDTVKSIADSEHNLPSDEKTEMESTEDNNREKEDFPEIRTRADPDITPIIASVRKLTLKRSIKPSLSTSGHAKEFSMIYSKELGWHLEEVQSSLKDKDRENCRTDLKEPNELQKNSSEEEKEASSSEIEKQWQDKDDRQNSGENQNITMNNISSNEQQQEPTTNHGEPNQSYLNKESSFCIQSSSNPDETNDNSWQQEMQDYDNFCNQWQLNTNLTLDFKNKRRTALVIGSQARLSGTCAKNEASKQ